MTQSRLKKFSALSFSLRMLFFEALFFQLIAGLVLKLIPFRRIPVFFPNPAQHSSLNTHHSHASVTDIKLAVQHTGRFSPWKNRCLVQSLAARWMLCRRGRKSQLALGVAMNDNKKMMAHAWIISDDIEIVEKRGDYLELFIF